MTLPTAPLATTIAQVLAQHLWDNSDEYVDYLAQHVAAAVVSALASPTATNAAAEALRQVSRDHQNAARYPGDYHYAEAAIRAALFSAATPAQAKETPCDG